MNKPDLSLVHDGDRTDQQAAFWFARLRADDVSQSDREAWQRWLEQARAHRDAYARIEALWSALGEFATAQGIGERLSASRAPAADALPTPAISRRREPPRRRRWPAALAAGVALIAAGAFFALRTGAPAEADYRTDTGERRSLQLEDGTRVDLDADTRLHVRYDRRGRSVRLEQGRAFFQVAKDASRPFEVSTDAGSVRALGTKFEVARLAGASDVALYEGSVELRARAQAPQPYGRLGVLVPGQRARLADDRMQVASSGVAAGSRPGWMSGRLVFNETPLAEAVAEFNRYNRTGVVLADPALRTQAISGVFRGDDVEGFVQALSEVYGIPEHHAADGSHVLGKAP